MHTETLIDLALAPYTLDIIEYYTLKAKRSICLNDADAARFFARHAAHAAFIAGYAKRLES